MMMQGWLRSRPTMRTPRSTIAAVHAGELAGTTCEQDEKDTGLDQETSERDADGACPLTLRPIFVFNLCPASRVPSGVDQAADAQRACHAPL